MPVTCSAEVEYLNDSEFWQLMRAYGHQVTGLKLGPLRENTRTKGGWLWDVNGQTLKLSAKDLESPDKFKRQCTKLLGANLIIQHNLREHWQRTKKAFEVLNDE